MELIEQKLKTLTSYHGVIVNVRLDEARLPDGSTAKREVVEHPGGVTVLPLEPDGTVWCVRQYRYPFSRTLLEVPAGKLEPGETGEQAIVREIQEELEVTIDNLDYLCTVEHDYETFHLSMQCYLANILSGEFKEHAHEELEKKLGLV